MEREDLILEGTVLDLEDMFTEIITLAKDSELVMLCYGRIMDVEEFELEVPEDDIITYFSYEEDGYIKVSTYSEHFANQISIDEVEEDENGTVQINA